MPVSTVPSRTSSRSRGPAWILVADAGRARLFESRWGDGGLVEIDDVINTPLRLRDAEIVSDRPGRSNQGPDGQGHAFESHESVAAHAEETFARALCARLARGRRRGEVARLYLLADPAFLGRLRRHLDRATRRIVVQETPTDLTRRTPAVIRKALPRVL